MKVVEWPLGWQQDEDSIEHEISTLDELWQLVERKFEAEFDGKAIMEISANQTFAGDKYLVITWVQHGEANDNGNQTA